MPPTRPETSSSRSRPAPSSGGCASASAAVGTAWSVLALRGAGQPVPRKTVAWLLARQTHRGGWGWSGAPDSNDTAAVVEALRAAGVRGRPIRRALAYLLRYRNADGGFELTS